MNKVIFLNQLSECLRKLPKEERDKAMAYYIEYFEEAGEENETAVLNDLGTPQSVANQIIKTAAIEKMEQPVTSVKKGFSTVWIVLLAIFSSPIALPLALVCGLLLLSLGIVVFALCFSVIVTGVSILGSAIVTFFAGFYLLFSDFISGVTLIGISTALMGGSVLISYFGIKVVKWVCQLIAKFFKKVIGGKKYESRK